MVRCYHARPGLPAWLGFAVSLTAAVLTWSSCVLKNPPDATAIKGEAMPKVQVPTVWTTRANVAGIVTDNWLAAFQDEQLTAAVTEAIANNADLRLAATRVEQAQLYAKLAGAKLYPSVDLLARGGGKMSGDSSGLQGAMLTLTWEVDLWGRVRYGRAAAAADARSAEADFEYARQSMAALVAKSWFLATEAGLQAEVARATIRDGEQLVSLAETRARVGVGNDEDLYVARANVGTNRDLLRQVELAREQAIRALELLLGRYPSAAAAVTVQLPNQPPGVPSGLPSELLERRPDVIAAERRVAAAFNRVHEAKAARLPAIALTTGVSDISSELFVLKSRDNPVWNFGANLMAPIYKGGALKTQVEIRTAEQKQAIASYASVGLRAFGEVENALAAEIAARDREQILTQTVADNQRATEIVQTQYKVGSTDLRYVTQRQLALNATQAALLRAQAEQRVQRVNLHLALGGSFEPRPQQQPQQQPAGKSEQ
jgi:multidrug efflux system outer membrane protein